MSAAKRDTAHRSRRTKSGLASQLDEVPGIGPARLKALLTHFGSVRAVRAASAAAIEEVPGFSAALANRVAHHLDS